MRLRNLLLITLLVAAFGVWATWIANDGRGLFFRGEKPPDIEHVLAKLAEPTSVAVKHVRLRDFVIQLAAEHDLDIRIDESDSPALGKTQVTLFADDITVWSAIRLALRQVERKQDLATALQGDSLVITTKESAYLDNAYYIGRVYPVAPLLMASGAVREKELAMVIETIIARGTWEDGGGVGVLRELPGALAVAHTLEVHVAIEQLLQRLQEIGESPDNLTPRDLHPPTAAAARACDALEEPAGLDFVDVPVSRALAELSDRCGVPIVVDQLGIERHFLPRYRITARGSERLAAVESRRAVGERPISAIVSELPLRDALSSMLHFPEVRLRPALRDEVIWITTQERAESLPVTRLYPVHDLFADHLAVDDWDYRVVGRLLAELIAPKTWTATSTSTDIEPIGGVLVIRQTPEVHQQIEELLSGIRRMLDPSQPRLASMSIPADSPIDQRLAEKTTLRSNSIPLCDIVDHLRQRHQLGIILDEAALEAAGLSGNVPITEHVEDVPLKYLLRKMLTPLGLVYAARGSGVLITTHSALDAERQLWLYDVRHLIDPDLGIVKPDELARLIKCVFQPHANNDGQIGFVQGILVISHCQGAQYGAADLLAALTKLQQEPQSLAPIPFLLGGRNVDQATLEMLPQDVSIRLPPMRLQRAARVLSQRFEVPIELDPVGAGNFFYDSRDSRVSLTATNIHLGAALEALVHRHGLACCPEHGRILISSWAMCKSAQVGRVYSVQDLCHHPATRPAAPLGPYGRSAATPSWRNPVPRTALRSDADLLCDLVQKHVDPTTWKEVGGTGSIGFVEDGLVVNNLRPTHRRIESFLAQLRHSLWPEEHPPVESPGVVRALDTPVRLSCSGLTVRDLLARVSKEHGIPVVIETGKPSFLAKPAGLLVPLAEDPFRRQRNERLFDYLFGQEHPSAVRPPRFWFDVGRALIRRRNLWTEDVYYVWRDGGLFGPAFRGERDRADLADLFGDDGDTVVSKDGGPSLRDYVFQVISPFFTRPDDDPFGLVFKDGPDATDEDSLQIHRDPSGESPPPSLGDPLSPATPLPRILARGSRWVLDRWRLELDVGDTMLPVDQAPSDFETMPLGQALQNAVEPVGLTVGVDGDALRVERPDDEHPLQFTQVYDVRQLTSSKRHSSIFDRWQRRVVGSRDPVARSNNARFRRQTPFIPGLFGFEEISQESFVAFVMSNVASPTWKDTGGCGAIDAYHGLLVVTNTWEVHHQLRACLDDLHRALARRGPATGHSSDSQVTDVATAIELIVSSQSDHVVAFGEYLFEGADFPASLAVAAIVERLETANSENSFESCRRLYGMLGPYGSDAAEAVPILAAQLNKTEDSTLRCTVIETLGNIGPAAGPTLAGYLNSNFDRVSQDDFERTRLVQALASAGESSVDALDPLLRLLAHAKKPGVQQHLAKTLSAIDPDGDRCRDIVTRWKDAKDEQTRQLACTAEERVRAIFGDPY